MCNLLKSISFIVLIFALTLVACDTEEKTTFIPIGGGTHHSAGDLSAYAADGVSFLMAYVPGGMTFPTGLDDDSTATVAGAYWIGETEVTYELWMKVYDWAVWYGYSFASLGSKGGASDTGLIRTNHHPVTEINWRDAMVWCNALTEWYNANNGSKPDLDCVYYINENYATPLRIVNGNDGLDTDPGHQDNPYIKASSSGNTDMAHCIATGFRLPMSMEWECAARYIDGDTWTAGDHASGATADFSNATATGLVAVYEDNSDSTAAVKSKRANALGLYDMSGNVWEWCFDWYTSGFIRVWRGGGWYSGATYLQVGGVDNDSPYTMYDGLGFRFARTAD